MRLDRAFFERHSVDVARDLIGCRLIRRKEGRMAEVIVTETEAYRGTDDPASHAHRGPTPRSSIMFGPAGYLYVYFSYGMHYCANLVTEQEGTPGAVLLRAANPIKGTDWIEENRPGVPRSNWLNGPGKLTKALGIDLHDNGYDAADEREDQLMIMSGIPLPFKASPRIGISKGKELLWRFVAQQAEES